MKSGRILKNAGFFLILMLTLLTAVQTFASPGPYVRKEAVSPEERQKAKPKDVSPYAWQKINGVCYNGSGKPIPGAITRGIDVSEWQGRINWSRVKGSNVDFAFIRLSHGFKHEDIYYDYNMKNATAANIPVGVYIYSTAKTNKEALAEAEYVIAKIKGYKISYPIVFDMEDSAQDTLTNDQRTDLARVFCDEIKKAGYYPMVYTNIYWHNYRLNVSRLREYDLWLASFGDTINRPDRNKYRYTIWQATGGSTTPGMNSTAGLIDGIPADNEADINFGFVDYTKIITPRTQPVSSYQSAGLLRNGWYKEGGKTYYYKNGIKQTGTLTIDDKKYNFSPVDGSMRVNKLLHYTFNGRYVYCGSDGAYVKNKWVTLNKWNKYYFGDDYWSCKGAVKINGKGYYFDPKTGVMKKNLKYVYKSGAIYYYAYDGVMATNGWRALTENGKKNVYYFCRNGNAYKSWHKIGGNEFFFYTDDYPNPGVRAENVILTIGNMKCKFNEKGICVKKIPIKK
ncbi:MAG: hypothetical protein J6D53_10420 [Blautia sp.]|nr:hypothetical protein [Blautia sp.]